MSPICSSWALFVLFSVCILSEARVLNRGAHEHIQDVDGTTHNELRRKWKHEAIFTKRQEETLDCSEDRFSDFLQANPEQRIETFCNEWLGIEPATVVVEHTPTITITTSAASTTTTSTTLRVIVTQTITQTATTTMASILPRAANVVAVAQDIFLSVLASGTTSEATSTKNEQRLQAESGLANACSCEMVDPTKTITQTFTVNPAYTTVGYRKLYVAKVTDTKLYTALVTVTVTPGQPSATSSSDLNSQAIGSSSLAASVTSSLTISSVVSSFALSGTIIPSSSSAEQVNGTKVTALASSTPSPPTVIAMPFSCPDASGKNIDQVVGDFKMDYLVYCNTELITQDRLRPPIDAESETSCTAHCSVINAQSGEDPCSAAAFTPYTDGRPGGSCVLSGGTPEYASKPGSVAVVHTGESSNSNRCDSPDPVSSSSNSVGSPIDVATVTGVDFALSTPGLITKTGDGGTFETYVSANSTDAGGTIHWSWFRVSASSSWWKEVYATSWSCTRTIVQTVVEQPPTSVPVIRTTALVTTIINGATTTILSGGSTTIYVGDEGLITPTFVPASTTSGNGEITTFFSSATQTSMAASGVISPSPGSVASASVPTPSAQISIIVGSTEVIVSGATSTFFSIVSNGVIPPPSSTSAPFNSSVAPSLNVSTIVSGGSAQFTSEGSTFSILSTGTDGIILPASTSSPVSSSASVAPSSFSNSGSYGSSSTVNWTYPINSTSVSATTVSVITTILGSTATSSSTELSGIIVPPFGTGSVSSAAQTIQAISNSSLPASSAQPIVTVSVGTSEWTSSGATATMNSTGSAGAIPPSPVPSSAAAVSESVIFGSANVTLGSSTFTVNSTGASGIVPPSGTVPSTPLTSSPSSTGSIALESTTIVTNSITSVLSLPPTSNVSSSAVVSSTPGLNVSFSVLSGTGFFSTASSFAFTSSTALSGIIPPSSIPSVSFPNVTVSSGFEIFSTAGSTATTSSTAASGVIPPSPANATTSILSLAPTPSVDLSSTGGANTITIQGSTAVLSSTASNGIITPSANSSSFPITSSTSLASSISGSIVPSSNISTTSSSLSSLASSGSIVPSSNSSIFVTPSPTSSLGLNTTSAGATFTNTGVDRSPFPIPSSSLLNTTSTGATFTNTGVDRSPFPIPSSSRVNATSTGATFTNTGVDRSPFPIPSSSTFNSSVTANTTAPIMPSMTPSSSLNFSSSAIMPSSSAVANITSQLTLSTSSITPITNTPDLPSSSIPPSSINATSSTTFILPPPIGNTTVSIPPAFSTLGVSSVLLNSSIPTSANLTRSTSSTLQSGIFTETIPPANTTASVTTSLPLPSSGIPVPSFNATSSVPQPESTIIPPFGNTTALTSGFTVASISTASISLNSTVLATIPSTNTTSVPSATPSASLNITSTPPFPTGNSTSIPSATPSLSLNSTTPWTCPTAPVTVTQVSVSVSVATTTLVQTQTLVQIQTVTAFAPVITTLTDSAPVITTLTPLASAPPPAVSDPPELSFANRPPAAFSTVAPPPASSTIGDLTSRFRNRGETPTQAQIDDACADTGNIVLNPNFAEISDGSVTAWSVDSNDPYVEVDSFADAADRSTAARFRSAAAGRSLTTYQPLTFCRGRQYVFSASSRQANTMADCDVEYAIVGKDNKRKPILVVAPQEDWVSKDTFFTADEAEGELWITAKCGGHEGMSVTDDEGWMRVEVKNVSVVGDV